MSAGLLLQMKKGMICADNLTSPVNPGCKLWQRFFWSLMTLKDVEFQLNEPSTKSWFKSMTSKCLLFTFGSTFYCNVFNQKTATFFFKNCFKIVLKYYNPQDRFAVLDQATSCNHLIYPQQLKYNLIQEI